MASGKKKKGRIKKQALSPVLTRNTIMQVAGPVYFGRGEEYYESRLVGGLLEFDGRITVRGRGTSRYEVNLWVELARKREKDFPEDALYVYRRTIEPTLEQKNKPAYKEAMGYIEKVSALMDRLGGKDEFLKYLGPIRTAHKRKRNFIKMPGSAGFS